MGLKVKVPVKEVEGVPQVCEVVERTLQNDPKNAYTVQGLMVEKFGVNADEIHNKPFSDRSAKNNTLYGRVYNCLEKLVKSEKVKSAKHEKARVYWWANSK